MSNSFIDIEDKRQLDELLRLLRENYRITLEARDTARAIITRKIKQPEWIRTVNRNLFPKLQMMSQELRELIYEAKEQRVNVQQRTARHADNNSATRQNADSAGDEGDAREA